MKALAYCHLLVLSWCLALTQISVGVNRSSPGKAYNMYVGRYFSI